MGQTLSIIVNDTVSVTLTAATLTGTQGSYVYGPVTASISPTGAATVHRISYELPDQLPVGMSIGAISDQWNWLRNGIARSATTSDTIVSPLSLTPPLTAALVGNGQFVCGDTGVAYQAVLTDGTGSPVDLSTATGGYLHIQYADGTLALTTAVTIADQTVESNLGLVSVPGVGATLTRASRALHEVRMEFSDGSFNTFKGTALIQILQPYTTP
ncbi:MAG TPA: hypothetical protein VN519_06880 [Bryobacteraceae bacterium]|nr:hypothetical protein [Bryobacteraceae bacterium]